MAVLLFALLALQSPLGDDQLQVDYTETVLRVNLPIKVRRGNHAFKSLRKNQLQIFENGKGVDVQRVERFETPLTFHFLFDLSTSNSDHIFQIKKTVRQLIDRMREGDRAKISFFSTRYQSLTDYTHDKQELMEKLARLTPIGSTALYDGLWISLHELREVKGPRVLILFSDGHDLLSTTDEADLSVLVKNHRIPILTITSGKTSHKKRPLLAAQSQFLQNLIQASGGEMYEAGGYYGRRLVKAVDQLRERYLLTFEPPFPEDLDRWRSLRISLDNCNDCSLEYRRAYRLAEQAR